MKNCILLFCLIAFVAAANQLHAQIGQDDLIMAIVGGNSSSSTDQNRAVFNQGSRSVSDAESQCQELHLTAPDVSGGWKLLVVTPTDRRISIQQVSTTQVPVSIEPMESGEYTYIFYNDQSIYYGKVMK